MTDSALRARLASGLVIPALPLALDEFRHWSERHQRALVRYYIEAGAGGLAVAVHSTQFEIRLPQHALFEPVLRIAAETMNAHAAPDFVRIAGICGRTEQALEEAALAKALGYHAGLVSPGAWTNASEADFLDHCAPDFRVPLVVDALNRDRLRIENDVGGNAKTVPCSHSPTVRILDGVIVRAM